MWACKSATRVLNAMLSIIHMYLMQITNITEPARIKIYNNL